MMSYQSSSPVSGIRQQELLEALPDSLGSKRVHLFWIELLPAGEEEASLTAKIGINDQVLLLQTRTRESQIIERWRPCDSPDPSDARLLALDRILHDPAHEDTLMAL